MVQKKRKKGINTPSFKLKEVKKLISQGKILINQNSLDGAYRCFNYTTPDIKSALLKIKANNFHKTEPSIYKPKIMIDTYKFKGSNDENIYTHFYIEDDLLIINSFKEWKKYE